MASITVEVVFAEADRQSLLAVTVPEGASLRDAIEVSGILERHPQIDLDRDKVGIFARLATLDDVLKEGDRVEIYRPLRADPKELRRRRAAKGAGQ